MVNPHGLTRLTSPLMEPYLCCVRMTGHGDNASIANDFDCTRNCDHVGVPDDCEEYANLKRSIFRSKVRQARRQCAAEQRMSFRLVLPYLQEGLSSGPVYQALTAASERSYRFGHGV